MRRIQLEERGKRQDEFIKETKNEIPEFWCKLEERKCGIETDKIKWIKRKMSYVSFSWQPKKEKESSE